MDSETFSEKSSEQFSENIIDSEDIENNIIESRVENVETEEIREEPKSEAKLVQLPLARIKSIIKMDPDVNIASADAVFAITKATEMFIDSIAKEAYSYTAKAKRKIITKKDLDTVIDTVDCLCFLDGAMDLS